MRIAFFLPDLVGGGAQRMIVNMANEFAARGHDVDLLLVSKRGAYEHLIAPSVNVIVLDKSRSYKALPSVIKYLKRAEPDIFLSAMFYMNVIALMAKVFLSFRSLKTKFVVTERNYFSLRVKDKGNRRDFLFPFLVYVFYRFADKVVGISNGVSDDIRKVAGLKHETVTTIYNPVVTAQTLLDLDERCDDTLFDEGQHSPLIVFSGRLVPQKDCDTLVRAFAEVLKRREARLLVLGEGVLQEEIQNLCARLKIEDHVYFKGFVKNPLAYMKQCDVFVLSSRWEGFGNVLVEALLCGLPIVSTDCNAGPAEILQGGEYGALVPVGDAEALADKLLAALTVPTDKEKQRQRAMDFTVQKICDQYEALFRALGKRHSS